MCFNACLGWKKSDSFSYKEINCKKYADSLKKISSAIIIDVRTPKEFAKSHIANAINMSYFDDKFAQRIDSLPKSANIYIYCHTQHRSPFAARTMKRLGFKQVIDLKGGFIRWERKNYPIQKI